MQSSSHRGRTVPSSCLSAWRTTFSAPPASLWFAVGGRCPRSLPAGAGGDGPWLAWGGGALPSPRDGVSGDSKLWGLIPSLVLPSETPSVTAFTGPLPGNARLRLSALNGHSINELLHLVRQPLSPGLLVLL